MYLNYPCNEYGRYIISKSDFEDLSISILKDKQPNVLNQPQPLDVDLFINEGLNLDLRSESLSQDGSILGLITFSDIKIPIFDINGCEQIISASEGTIILDKNLLTKHTREVFTKAHEASHWILHRRFFSDPSRKFNFRNGSCSYIACRKEAVFRKNPTKVRTEADWCEWQSDHLAAALLMPYTTFVNTALELFELHEIDHVISTKTVYSSNVNYVISTLSELFGVSRRSVLIRLSTLGLIV